MPIYEYECKNCGERFQALLLAGEDDGKMACPRCGARGVKKVISLFSVGSEPTSSSGCKPSGSA